MPTAASRPEESSSAKFQTKRKEAQNALPFCLPFSKACVILLKHAGLVYRYYSSFPSWLGGFDSRTLLQKRKSPVRVTFFFGISSCGSRTGAGVNGAPGALQSRDPASAAAEVDSRTLLHVRRSLLRSASPVCVSAGKAPHPQSPSSFPKRRFSRGNLRFGVYGGISAVTEGKSPGAASPVAAARYWLILWREERIITGQETDGMPRAERSPL